MDDVAGISRVELGFTPTPLHPLHRLTNAIKGSPRVWIKRDDCTGLATGGNKTRKLEFLMSDALAQRADTVITYGAVQSNHARQTAAACAKLGLECHLMLSRRVAWQHPDYETGGNVLLDRLCGAHLHLVEADDVESRSRALIDELSARGRRCYVVPTGGSNSIGALGYVRCANEIVEQSRALGFTPDAIVHATSSGGTQAGLIAGVARARLNWDVVGINVYDRDHARLERRIARLTEETAHRIGVESIPATTPHVVHDYLGEDYGIPTRQTIDAIKLLASTEGIVCDPVYSGKALGGLIDMLRAGAFEPSSNVIFVHTGGVASLPVYRTAFPPDQR
jgi:L-cysteate sulfo-lyase